MTGASGTTYRFRRSEPDLLPATAGNLIVVSGPPAKRSFRLCAVAPSLSQTAQAAREALAGARGAGLYIRLNVSRAAREAEHTDIVAAVAPEAEVRDPA